MSIGEKSWSCRNASSRRLNGEQQEVEMAYAFNEDKTKFNLTNEVVTTRQFSKSFTIDGGQQALSYIPIDRITYYTSLGIIEVQASSGAIVTTFYINRDDLNGDKVWLRITNPEESRITTNISVKVLYFRTSLIKS